MKTEGDRVFGENNDFCFECIKFEKMYKIIFDNYSFIMHISLIIYLCIQVNMQYLIYEIINSL